MLLTHREHHSAPLSVDVASDRMHDVNVIEQARHHIDLGFLIFPVWGTRPDGTCRCPAGAACAQKPGKHPATPHGFKDAGTSTAFLNNPGTTNYGMVWPGGADTVFLWDVDGDDWRDRLTALTAKYGPLPATKNTKTPNGGLHVFYRWPPEVPVPSGDLFGFVTRWPMKGYVVGPGSAIGERIYEDKGSKPIATLPLAWARAVLVERPKVDTSHGSNGATKVAAGARHAFLVRKARALYAQGLTGEDLFAAVRSVNLTYCDPPKTDEEVRRAIGDVESKFAPDPVEESPEAGGPASLPPFRRALDVLDSIEDTMDEWLVTDLFRPGRWGILAGYEGDGKSRIRSQMAWTVTDPRDGDDLFGMYSVPGPLAVAVVDMENGDREEARRDRELMDALGTARSNVSDRYIRLSQDDAFLSLADKEHVAHICTAIDTLHVSTSLPVLLVLDSADSLHDGPLWGHDLSVLKNAMRIIRDQRPWLFVLLVAHLNKRGVSGRTAGLERELEDVSGNLTRQADVVILLDSKGPERMRMAVRKRVPNRTVFLTREDGGPLWTFAADATAGPTGSSKVPQGDLLSRMVDGAIYGIKDVMDWYAASRDTARRALDAAVSAGLLDSTPASERGKFSAVHYWKAGTR
jgi:hypothetical protein